MKEQILFERQQEQEGMLRNGRMINAGREKQRDPKLRAALHVDLVDADAIFGEHLEPLSGFLEHGPRDGVVATDVAVDLAHEGERVGLAQRATGGNDLPAGGGEFRMVVAGSVLKRSGRDENAGRHEGFRAIGW